MKMEKIAATVLFAILLHIVFSSIGASYDLAVVYWLLYTLACGTIINYDQDNNYRRLLIYSIPSPLVVVGATYYRSLFNGAQNCWLSGIECELDIYFAIRSLVFFGASVFFIWVFSYLSEWAINVSLRLFKMSDAQAKKIRLRIIWIGTVVVAIVGVVQIIAHQWRLG